MDMVKQVHSMLWAITATELTVYCCTATATLDIASACVHPPSEAHHGRVCQEGLLQILSCH